MHLLFIDIALDRQFLPDLPPARSAYAELFRYIVPLGDFRGYLYPNQKQNHDPHKLNRQMYVQVSAVDIQ